MDRPLIVYLHGFCSSPASWKSRLLAEEMARRGLGAQFVCPPLSPVPDEAVACVENLIGQASGPVVLVGSSLGGHYANHLAEKHDLRAALINPAVNPARLWHEHLGENRNYYSGRRYTITQDHVEQLRAIDTPVLRHPGNFLLLVQTGDETLDYRLAVDKYKDSTRIIQDGGNHGFVGYEAMLPTIFEFLAPSHHH